MYERDLSEAQHGSIHGVTLCADFLRSEPSAPRSGCEVGGQERLLVEMAQHPRVSRFDWPVIVLGIAVVLPDVVALQEWAVAQTLPCVFAEGWHLIREQELVVASRIPIAATERLKSLGSSAYDCRFSAVAMNAVPSTR